MKKRIVLLSLVFALVLSVAAPVMGVNLGDTLTKEVLEQSGLTQKWTSLGGAWLKGDTLDLNGNVIAGTSFRPAGLKSYVDEEGNLYMFMWVQSGGELKLQCVFSGKAPDPSSLSDTQPDWSAHLIAPVVKWR